MPASKALRVPFVVALLLSGLVHAPALAQARTPAIPASQAVSVLDDPFVQNHGKRGLDFLYNMKFEEANYIFEQIDRRYPEHPVGPFLKALNTWWHILLDLSDESYDRQFVKQMEEVVRRSDRILKRDKRNPDAMFFKSAAYAFEGRLHANRRQWLKAALDGRRAMSYVFDLAKLDPDNDDFIFAAGIYDYYSDVIRENYPIARPFMAFFPNGNRERGLLELNRTAQNGTYIQTEAVYFLLQIFYMYEHDREKSIEYVTWLRQKYPDNPFFHTFEGRIYARWGQWARSEAIFQEVLKKYGMPGYNNASAEQAFYYIARAKFAYGQYEEALHNLKQLDRLLAGRKEDVYWKVWGRVRQGMIYDALGRRDEAVAMYRSVLKMKNIGEAHERAKEYLKTPFRYGQG